MCAHSDPAPTDVLSIVDRAAHGDAEASRALVAVLWPTWIRIARGTRALRAVPARDEAAREVATRLAEKLGRPGSAELRAFFAWARANPTRSFDDWIRIVTVNAARDVARAELGRRDDPSGEVSPKRLLNELARHADLAEIGARPPITNMQAARQLAEMAEAILTADQRAALRAWLEGATYEEIAASLGLADAAEGKRVLRAGIALLRRRFGEVE